MVIMNIQPHSTLFETHTMSLDVPESAINQPPIGPWETEDNKFVKTESLSGRPDLGWGTVKTLKQKMFASVELTPYRYTSKDRTSDYYLLFGTFSHGIQDNPINAATNWASVGYYADHMNLKITCTTGGARPSDYGPNSTIRQATTSFNIGVNASGTNTAGGGGLSGGFAVSFASPEVTFAVSPGRNSVNWRVNLPKVGWLSPSVPANPGTASYNGYLWRPAVIFAVPKGQPCGLLIEGEVHWRFDWTRGVHNDKKVFLFSEPFCIEPLPALPEAGHASQLTLHTILETLRRREEFETLLSALRTTGIEANFSEGTDKMTLMAPTDHAFLKFLTQESKAQQLLGPGTELNLYTFLQRLLKPDDLTLELGDTPEGLATTMSGNTVRLRNVDGVLEIDDIRARERIPCKDGVILVLDTIPAKWCP